MKLQLRSSITFQCSKSCDQGTVTREVYCSDNKSILREEKCNRKLKPAAKRNCLVKKCVMNARWVKGHWNSVIVVLHFLVFNCVSWFKLYSIFFFLASLVFFIYPLPPIFSHISNRYLMVHSSVRLNVAKGLKEERFGAKISMVNGFLQCNVIN